MLINILEIQGQKTIPFSPINSSNALDTNFSDLSCLDSIAEMSQLIGIGEATHGTSEFTTMRHRVFKFLVEKHSYNTFFLEADFGACQRVNRYIHGETDTVQKALNEVVLWPWSTEEMIDLIEWMRFYNSTHLKNKIQFVGCDMQILSANLLELKRFLIQNSLSNAEQIDSFLILSKTKNDSLSWNSLLDRLNSIAGNLIDSKLEKTKMIEFIMLKQTITQYVSFDSDTRDNSRDSCMAQNIITYLELNPQTKGIYFAHNAHVSKMHYDGKYMLGIQNKWAGYFLNKVMKKKYFTIAQELYQGSFNAVTWDDGGIRKFKIFNLEPSEKKTLGNYFNSFGYENLFCFAKDIPRLNYKRNTFIGAVYGKDDKGINQGRYGWEGIFFDAFIFIKSTSASHLYFLKE